MNDKFCGIKLYSVGLAMSGTREGYFSGNEQQTMCQPAYIPIQFKTPFEQGNGYLHPLGRAALPSNHVGF